MPPLHPGHHQEQQPLANARRQRHTLEACLAESRACKGGMEGSGAAVKYGWASACRVAPTRRKQVVGARAGIKVRWGGLSSGQNQGWCQDQVGCAPAGQHPCGMSRG